MKFGDRFKDSTKSIRVKLFITLAITVLILVFIFIFLNNVVLETYYAYFKQKVAIEVYDNINNYNNANLNNDSAALAKELELIAINNNFDIVIKSDEGIEIYSTNKSFLPSNQNIYIMEEQLTDSKDIMYETEDIIVKKVTDTHLEMNFILLTGRLDNGYEVYIRTPINSIKESVKVSNKFLYFIAAIGIAIGGIIVVLISGRFTKPIVELNEIAKKMARLDFSKKYRINDTDDEINNLGKSINTMSDKLEKTIKELRKTNIELERDIEKKSKIESMRKQFISDVSHELKTPIALIQAYTEGLIENISKSEEDRNFYASTIMDEANKMDNIVKRLLELSKLEYGKREFINETFNITELVREVVKNNDVKIKENKIKVVFDDKTENLVYADQFYANIVFTNYFTNALNNIKEVKRNKEIKIDISENLEKGKIRIEVYNTGDNIQDEVAERLWTRFYKSDESRNRESGGTGIGLSLVKAIMNNYQNDFGFINEEDGVKFYFELDREKDIKKEV